MNMSVEQRPEPHEAYRRVETCPGCNTETTLVYVGEQHWPEHIARKLGVRFVLSLWRCEKCLSTITLND
jgi:uncharacterized protein with PIN domain